MSDQSQPPSGPPNAAPTPEPASVEPQAPSLRETIEQAYDDTSESPDTGQEGRVRDSNGRFAAKDRVETGEAERLKAPPSPERLKTEAQKPPTDPAAQASSNQVPEHWSANLKSAFNKWAPDVQGEFLNRHREMEADYTRKSQAASGAVNFTNTLTPVFTDPAIRQSLEAEGVSAAEAIHQWAGFHKRAMAQDPRERMNLLVDLAQRIGFDPARLFVTAQSNPPPVLSPKDLADPAIRYFADHQSRTAGELQALKAELQQMRQAEVQQREQESLEQTRWGIDQFAAEKGPDGQPLRPHFDAVLPHIIKLFKADPESDLHEAYLTAVRMDKDLYEQALAADRAKLQGQSNVDRAKAALRGNTRGMTAPVSKPNAKVGNGRLRDMLEEAADEVGLN